jgi:drug/metabolite transporter (DMT)-like permease
MNWGLIVAIISPCIWGFMNIFDKTVLSHKVKNTLGYSILAGIVNITFGLIIVLALNWKNVSWNSLLFPILAGIISGAYYYLYFWLMNKHDASYMIGLVYLYPVVVAVLSFVFLNERLTGLGYAATLLILTGIVLLSLRAKKINLKIAILPIIICILVLGVYEFFIKVSTDNLGFMQGLGVDILVSGMVILFGLFSRKVRAGFKEEIKNIKWAYIGEFISLVAIFSSFLAMSLMPATVVSSIGAIQPLAVLIFERIAHKKFGKIMQDLKFLPKLIAILFIIAGIILFSLITS